jgi:hypothetical protein
MRLECADACFYSCVLSCICVQGVKRNYESLLARQGLSKDPIPITTHLITAPTEQETEAQLAERMKQPPPKPVRALPFPP